MGSQWPCLVDRDSRRLRDIGTVVVPLSQHHAREAGETLKMVKYLDWHYRAGHCSRDDFSAAKLLS